MKLYYVPGTRAWRVRWMLEELGVPYELARLDARKGETRTPGYLTAVHPLGHVPALEDGGAPLLETGAIIAWLAERFPEKQLAPAHGTAERGRYFQWLFYGPVTLEPPLEAYALHGAPSSRLAPEERVPAQGEAGRLRFLETAAPLARALEGKEFLLGQFSAADVLVGGILSWAAMLKLLGDFPVLQDYVTRLRARPALQRARAD